MALEDAITVCADCGATITQFPAGSGRWARLVETNTTTGLTVEKDIGVDFSEVRKTYDFCCRVVYDTSGDPPYRVLRADYHHPVWANQRHFAPKGEGA